MTETPAISLVMPCYQQAAYLEQAVRSVLTGHDVEAELIVQDPGSTDGSRELLEGLVPEFGSRLVLRLEADDGQADAVNRGMAVARGQVLGWLNSDDVLEKGALDRVLQCTDWAAGPRWAYGQAGMIDEEGREIRAWIGRYKERRGRRFSIGRLLTENFISQMATFWNRALWDQTGGLDVGRELDMDYDLWLRFARTATPTVLPQRLAHFRVHRDAKSSRQVGEQLAAAHETARRHARGLGWRGHLALVLHRLFRWRTQLCYRWLKPR